MQPLKQVNSIHQLSIFFLFVNSFALVIPSIYVIDKFVESPLVDTSLFSPTPIVYKSDPSSLSPHKFYNYASNFIRSLCLVRCLYGSVGHGWTWYVWWRPGNDGWIWWIWWTWNVWWWTGYDGWIWWTRNDGRVWSRNVWWIWWYGHVSTWSPWNASWLIATGVDD